jgi:hypothetical protein
VGRSGSWLTERLDEVEDVVARLRRVACALSREGWRRRGRAMPESILMNCLTACHAKWEGGTK